MTASMESLLQRAKEGDREASEQLVEENTGLIWSIARRFFGRGVDADDLYQLGCVGFLKAIAGFDLAYGTQFSTYAVPKIAGEIRRFLRDDGSVKVSRTLKEQATAVKMARQRLCGSLGREPTLGELADETGFTPEEIATAETATTAAESIQRPAGEDGFRLEDVLSSDGIEDAIIESVWLREAMAQLPERERMLLELRFFHGLTQDRTARVLGLSQVQISRLEKKALQKLRNFVE